MITKPLLNETSRVADFEGQDEISLYKLMGQLKIAVERLSEVGAVVYRALASDDPEAPPTTSPWICRIAVVKDATNPITWTAIAQVLSQVAGTPVTLQKDEF